MRDAFVRALLREMAQDPRVVLITGDLGFGVLRPVKEQYPDRLINAGIAEQSMVGLAAGLAMTGRKVVVYSIGNFPTLRPLEQIRNDCAYHGLDVKIVCVGGGFVYGSLGMSHHATEDMAILRAIPEITCFTPGDPAETEAAVPVMFATPGTCYLRLGRGNEPYAHEEKIIDWTFPQSVRLREGKDIALLSAGGILVELKRAAEQLAEMGVSAEVVSFPCLKPMDREAILEIAARHRDIITVEEHNIVGGFGSAVCEVIAESGAGSRVHRLGLEDCFTTVVGDQAYLRHVYGMDAEAIVKKTMEIIGKR
ncbi:MAG: transketolase [Clostridia bacterium]|nr:transketolase [Clostridia bacterium]